MNINQLIQKMLAAEVVARDRHNLLERHRRQRFPISDLHGFYGIAMPSASELWVEYENSEHFLLFNKTDVGPWFTLFPVVPMGETYPARVTCWAEVLVVDGRPLSETFRFADFITPPELGEIRDKIMDSAVDLVLVQMGAALTQFAKGYMRTEKPRH